MSCYSLKIYQTQKYVKQEQLRNLNIFKLQKVLFLIRQKYIQSKIFVIQLDSVSQQGKNTFNLNFPQYNSVQFFNKVKINLPYYKYVLSIRQKYIQSKLFEIQLDTISQQGTNIYKLLILQLGLISRQDIKTNIFNLNFSKYNQILFLIMEQIYIYFSCCYQLSLISRQGKNIFNLNNCIILSLISYLVFLTINSYWNKEIFLKYIIIKINKFDYIYPNYSIQTFQYFESKIFKI
eukprot:TRINITY_DN3809_c0_g1_i13.p2 TRINITY_DN3809_c0_g1~~TRINITY_DN3809_c0_g1_i13.p2  ORF type:complete len:235 (+),score=-36.40 TRINITY_DN3809_c0_g1_i13:340-1044(+)